MRPEREEAPKKHSSRLAKELKSWGKTLASALVLALLIKNFLIVNAYVISGSMEDTIMTGDRVICNRLAYLADTPQRYDVIAFDFYEDGIKRIYVKRIIGLPGERVEIFGGKVYIGGCDAPLSDSFVKGDPDGDFGPFQVPEGCYFVLGDNREASFDSKSWPDPYLPRQRILGKAMFSYYPSIKKIAAG